MNFLKIEKIDEILLCAMNSCRKRNRLRVAKTEQGRYVIYCEHCLEKHKNFINVVRTKYGGISRLTKCFDREAGLYIDVVSDKDKIVKHIQRTQGIPTRLSKEELAHHEGILDKVRGGLPAEIMKPKKLKI